MVPMDTESIAKNDELGLQKIGDGGRSWFSVTPTLRIALKS